MVRTFSSLIASKFSDSNMTEKEYADFIGIDRTSLRKHIRGESVPKIRVLRRYSAAYSTSVGDLIGMIKAERGYYNG